MVLYRAVSMPELLDIQTSQAFRTMPGQMEGKWFAERVEEAVQWGRVLYGGHFTIVRAHVPDSMADRLFRLPMINAIGPARFIEGTDLTRIKPLL